VEISTILAQKLFFQQISCDHAPFSSMKVFAT